MHRTLQSSEAFDVPAGEIWASVGGIIDKMHDEGAPNLEIAHALCLLISAYANVAAL